MYANKKIVFITRATLYKVKGGDTFQVLQTARHLEALGVEVDIRLTHEKIDYDNYDLLHFFNIIRPADILFHIRKAHKPFVVSTMLIDYTGYDKHHRKGVAGLIFRSLSANTIEYVKTIARFVRGKDKLVTWSYLWEGHKRAIREILSGASLLFSNSGLEHKRLIEEYNILTECITIPNGLDTDLFVYDDKVEKDSRLILCVARIEGIKNQMNLIRALNNTSYRLLIIGAHAPNQYAYYRECRRMAGPNVEFIGHLPQNELVQYYQRAKVHILPSWFETCGLSSLEAGAMGCNIVVTDKGYTKEYYEDFAFYCDPGHPHSILNAVDRAARAGYSPDLRDKILSNYTWRQAAARIAAAYDQLLN
ncbi:MAG: glycosyltransferase family 4 protein [Bacteroidota bacterium]|nr:glycosyltransferase family 4 protein [Bacteroidota bacterium]MDP4215975.1 glycosyltransferase family 4 protein [Bacteroidota bacterium]MDP4245102.1 glycosyltransferase family 4 protein [Bacteroidota bacterium]MDP4257836.1 glycosyltransferase family 4 protein [Bacteroidota bacterium]